MESGLIQTAPCAAACSSPEIAIIPGSSPARGAMAGDWSSVADQPWQQILDEVVVELVWSAGSEELDALSEAVLLCATGRQRRLSVRTLAEWIRVTLSEREHFQRYMHDPSIPARQRAALARDLGASSQRIEALVSALMSAAEGAMNDRPAPALMRVSPCSLDLGAADAPCIDMALRAQASIIERRLNQLIEQLAQLA